MQQKQWSRLGNKVSLNSHYYLWKLHQGAWDQWTNYSGTTTTAKETSHHNK